jgi:hypothetical protein
LGAGARRRLVGFHIAPAEPLEVRRSQHGQVSNPRKRSGVDLRDEQLPASTSPKPDASLNRPDKCSPAENVASARIGIDNRTVAETGEEHGQQA